MGEVWRARDIRLSREVAVKVVPEEFSHQPERLRRFEKEARATSALNHPNIVTIYEIEQIDSNSLIVMELVEGKTLREVLAEGVLPARKLLAIAAQIADGLARAHASGIVHRDLKPENVMMTKEGLVKILDHVCAGLGAGREKGRTWIQATGKAFWPLLAECRFKHSTRAPDERDGPADWRGRLGRRRDDSVPAREGRWDGWKSETDYSPKRFW